MAPLNSGDIQRLADSILQDLSGTEYACLFLHRIPGGSTSFTFRGILHSPLVMPDGSTIPSVIVKKATDFAAINSDFALDSRRSAHENIMLKALSQTTFSTSTGPLSIRTPLAFFYVLTSQIQIIEDLWPARSLADIIMSHDIDSQQADFAKIGFALGVWLRTFHDWSKGPEQDRLDRDMRDSGASRELKWRTTYETIVDIARGLPTIPKKYVDVLVEIRSKAMLEHKQWLKSSSPQLEGPYHGLIHGDFWTGNVLFTSVPKPQLHIIDFEFAHMGHRATDLGQMIGDLLEKSYVSDSRSSVRENCEAVIAALVKGYGAFDDEIAYSIVIHAGTHMINWCARHPRAGVRGKVDELMQGAVAIIVKAWEEDREWFDRHILGCLFRRCV